MKTFSKRPGLDEKLVEISCPVCNSNKYHPLWSLETFSYSKCPECSLVYQNPQPVKEHVEKRYDGEYFNYEIENQDAFLNLILLGLRDVGFIPDKIESETRSVLDIGCATGLFLSHMKSLGWRTSGVEVCRSAAEYGNKKWGVNIFSGTLDEADFEDNSFDIVHLSHVIEHINDPLPFLMHINRVLKPGGVLYCTTPNINGFQAKLFKDRWRSAIADHMVLFSNKTLNRILDKAGFSNLKYKTWGGMCAGSGYPKIVKKFLDIVCKPLNFGDVMIFRAIKK